MSGQLLWSNDGADCSLLVSPENVKVCWLSGVDVVAPWTAAPLAGAGRSSIQGTGTSFPALAVVEPGVVEVVEVVPAVLVFASVPELELSAITAKSIRPDAGLKMTSLMVPSDCP